MGLRVVCAVDRDSDAEAFLMRPSAKLGLTLNVAGTSVELRCDPEVEPLAAAEFMRVLSQQALLLADDLSRIAEGTWPPYCRPVRPSPIAARCEGGDPPVRTPRQ